ncbi:unnamed protein product [Candidula unifasciata]|uniref:Uncharacterized protein n=1 Tax=Candidula unifasciata TaxID=100452 RepID=A0A8S3Z1P3_9EUPU|nr:unnamed protein product [Candidula unifasciata]
MMFFSFPLLLVVANSVSCQTLDIRKRTVGDPLGLKTFMSVIKPVMESMPTVTHVFCAIVHNLSKALLDALTRVAKGTLNIVKKILGRVVNVVDLASISASKPLETVCESLNSVFAMVLSHVAPLLSAASKLPPKTSQ